MEALLISKVIQEYTEFLNPSQFCQAIQYSVNQFIEIIDESKVIDNKALYGIFFRTLDNLKLWELKSLVSVVMSKFTCTRPR
ncbi:unnamed protein product [Paramecium sonneborni]|uniref:Uncharacterized protein n=1 Tax=Paramecium sonneborni TaxID=65129 RepID=A0A8S1RQY9_9CILI|nr:unnamed protein product [Paramecium sonneborni]